MNMNVRTQHLKNSNGPSNFCHQHFICHMRSTCQVIMLSRIPRTHLMDRFRHESWRPQLGGCSCCKEVAEDWKLQTVMEGSNRPLQRTSNEHRVKLRGEP